MNLTGDFIPIPLISNIKSVPINVAPGNDKPSNTESVRELNPVPSIREYT
jgi:hypothetical protein